MGTETERKFLVDRVPAGLTGPEGIPIEQGYLAIDEQSEVRLRRAGEALTLTVKNGHGETRDETEVEVDQATFDDLWPESEARRIEKVRRKIDLEDGLVAELDIYAGTLEGVSVVEVEFESAEQAAGFIPPAWFGRELTGDRAWANQELAVSGKPEKRLEYRIRPGEEPGNAICRVITARASQAAAAVRRAGEAEDSAPDVHEARKSLKKVRSALRLLRGVISDEERKAANATCRDASAALAGARDAEVKLATLELVTGDGPETQGAGKWRAGLEAEAAGHRGDLTPPGLARVAGEIETVARNFRGRELAAASEEIAGNLGRGYRRGRKSMKKARKGDDPEDFHDWRKRAKDLRYQLEILEPGLPDEFSGIRKQAEELADQLGDLHDLDVLTEDLNGRGFDSTERDGFAELISAAHEHLAGKCLDLGKETYEMKPGRFTNRVGEALSESGDGSR